MKGEKIIKSAYTKGEHRFVWNAIHTSFAPTVEKRAVEKRANLHAPSAHPIGFARLLSTTTSSQRILRSGAQNKHARPAKMKPLIFHK